MSSLIIYFSRTGGNYVAGDIRNLEKGNTEIVAEMIQKLTGAELFEAEPVVPYSDDYSACIEEAKNDKKRDARPELKKYPEHMESFEKIYLGYPNYWGTMAMFTLLEHFDFAGKTILPFCTHEGSGLGDSVRDIRRLCPGADVRPGLAITGSRAAQAEKEVKKWILKEEKECRI